MRDSLQISGEMVSAEHALEHMSVEKAWNLLDALSFQVQQKQTELQLMVGSRYHELIESADSIVSMKEISSEVLGLLKDFPRACSNVLGQVPSATRSCGISIRDGDTGEGGSGRRLAEVVQVMLHAPAGMWAALDSNKVLEATHLLLRCRSSWADVSSSFFEDIDPSLAAFLRSHVTYVEQFPHRIISAGMRMLTRSCSTEETAGALAALLQLEAHHEAEPLRCLLELFLRRRGGAVVALLTRAAKKGAASDVEDVLRKVLAIVQKTIVDIHAMFSVRCSGNCLLVELAHPSRTLEGSPRLPAHVIKGMCTQWLNLLAAKIRVFSADLLSAVGNTTTLANIRGALWALTHGQGRAVVSGTEKCVISLDNASWHNVWREAVAFAIDASVVGDCPDVRGMVLSRDPLDLWALFFSSIFAELAETLLKNSLLCIRRNVERRLDSILLDITGRRTEGAVRDGCSGFVTGNCMQSHPLVAHDILAAAEAVVSLLTSELHNLAEDAWSLTERGDEAAADALRTSFYLLCVEMAAGLANHFRIALQEIQTCIESAAKQERGLARDGEFHELENAVGSFADAGLVIGRIAWMLNGRSGRPLQSALQCPGCFARKFRGRIEQQQLEAAFVIADTNGDGIVDADEAAEALQAVSFGTSAERVLDPTPYSSFTLTEFFLFATRLLEEQRPVEHLSKCLDELLVDSLAMWAQWALERPAKLLVDICKGMATLCCSREMTDTVWRQTHGIWEDKTIELDRDDGDGVEETIHIPVMVSPAFLCYIEGVAAELSRVLSVADLLSVSSPEMRNTDGTPQVDTLDDGEWKRHRHLRGIVPPRGSAHRARSLAAVRASTDLKQALAALCDGPQSAAAKACEAAQLQLLLDALFLQKWVLDSEPAASSVESTVATLCDLVDPINLQIYMPHLLTAASVCWSACHTSLSLIFEETSDVQGGVVVGASMTPDGAVGSSSSFVALVAKVRRFKILPLPLDAVRLMPANGKPHATGSVRHKSRGEAGEEGTDASAQARGMQAGRQALAGLMDQVGSVGSVLSAQNVNVQSVLGAASLFLGGRNRRGDGEEGF